MKEISINPEYKFIISPTETDLQEIRNWLINEEQEFSAGFYCNWNIIEKAFFNKELVCFNYYDNPIGFVVWSKGEIYAEIDIFEIKPDFRCKEIGRILFNHTSDYFKRMGFLAIKLFCSPRESEGFWKKMNFTKFPDRGYSESDLIYFKPLVNTGKSSNSASIKNKIELWNLEPYQIQDQKSSWVWEIEFEIGTKKLLKPILLPCNVNWNLRWTQNGEIIKEDKIKYFAEDDIRIEYAPFLYIKELKHSF